MCEYATYVLNVSRLRQITLATIKRVFFLGGVAGGGLEGKYI